MTVTMHEKLRGSTHMKGKLVMTIGPPGSGKSTFIKNNLSGDKDFHVSSDAIREELMGTRDDMSRNAEVFSIFEDRVVKGLTLFDNVYADATFCHARFRQGFLYRVRGIPSSITGYVFMTALHHCMEMNRNRIPEHVVPDDVVVKMYQDLIGEHPTLYEGFDKLIAIRVKPVRYEEGS